MMQGRYRQHQIHRWRASETWFVNSWQQAYRRWQDATGIGQEARTVSEEETALLALVLAFSPLLMLAVCALPMLQHAEFRCEKRFHFRH
jgi:hypothetical protein